MVDRPPTVESLLPELEATRERLTGELADVRARIQAVGSARAASTLRRRAELDELERATAAALVEMAQDHDRRIDALRRAADDEVARILGDGRARAAVLAASGPTGPGSAT